MEGWTSDCPSVCRKEEGELSAASNRHDYAVPPFGETALDALKETGLDVISVGKINDIFVGHGITEAFHSNSSVHGMEQTIEIAKEDFHGLCFVNLVDFDALWGHREIRSVMRRKSKDLTRSSENCFLCSVRMIC